MNKACQKNCVILLLCSLLANDRLTDGPARDKMRYLISLSVGTGSVWHNSANFVAAPVYWVGHLAFN